MSKKKPNWFILWQCRQEKKRAWWRPPISWERLWRLLAQLVIPFFLRSCSLFGVGTKSSDVRGVVLMLANDQVWWPKLCILLDDGQTQPHSSFNTVLQPKPETCTDIYCVVCRIRMSRTESHYSVNLLCSWGTLTLKGKQMGGCDIRPTDKVYHHQRFSVGTNDWQVLTLNYRLAIVIAIYCLMIYGEAIAHAGAFWEL